MDKPLISFCTPVHGDAETIEAQVNSILDQDWPAIEQIICVDGDPESEKKVKEIVKKHPQIQAIYLKENQGACVARNEAAKLAKGKYLSFLPADARLFPGVVRIWVETLEENPDYDFLYGGYRLVGEGGFDYLSEGFDPYFLDSHNYIDGSFPLKREVFEKIGGWDPKIKSLQDWDLWLAVVKSGSKGLFIRDIFFDTDMPHKGGLSDDSSRNWIQRTDEIKKKYKIKDRDICVASLGAPFHGKRIARILNADFKEMPSFKPHRYKLIYLIGFFPTMADLCAQVFRGTSAKKVIHWIGSDIWQMQQMDLANRKILLAWFRNNIDEHFCEADFTRKELKELGVEAKVVRLPPRWLYEYDEKLPEKFTVACYWPTNNKDFYMPKFVQEIAALCPEFDFKFYGDNNLIGKKGNIEYVGYISDMEKFIKSCSAIMRFTIHDGLPISVLEFILAGRNAICSVPVKYATHAQTSSPAVVAQALRQLAKMPANKKGSAYWRKELSHKKFNNVFSKIMEYNPKEYWENRAESWSQLADTNYSIGINEWLGVQEAFKKALGDKKGEDFSVLDVGCGNGRFIRMFDEIAAWKEAKYDYLGIDISKKLIDISKGRYPEKKFEAVKLEDYKPQKKYDVVFSYTCLEHIVPEDLPKALKVLYASAKKAIIVEPINFNSAYYCYSHDYKKYLPHVLYERQGEDKMVYLVDLESPRPEYD